MVYSYSMGKISKLQDIETYQKSLELAKNVFDLCKTDGFKSEYALVDQFKKCCVSVPANIAEGYGRHTKADFGHFLSIVLGSCNEMIALLDLASLIIPSINLENLENEYNILGKRVFTFRKSILV